MSGRAFHVADNWIERAIRVLRRAEVSHACMRLARQPLQERRRQSRLAYARLSREQHDLALARFRVGPAPLQQVAFFLPPDQGGQTISVQRLETALLGASPEGREGARRPGDALEV